MATNNRGVDSEQIDDSVISQNKHTTTETESALWVFHRSTYLHDHCFHCCPGNQENEIKVVVFIYFLLVYDMQLHWLVVILLNMVESYSYCKLLC